MAKLGKRSKKLILEAMAGLIGAAAKARAQELSNEFKVSASVIYRITKDVRPSRAKRSDSGISRHGVSEEALSIADALMFDQNYTAERAVEILEANNLIGPNQMSAGTYRREVVKRTGGTGCKQLKRLAPSKIKPVRPFQNTHRRMEADYPGQVFAVDFTMAQQYYVNDAEGIMYQSPLAHRKNAPNPKGRQLWIYAITDLFSRARFSKAYPGMDTTFFLDFMYQTMIAKDDFPFYGVCEYLRSDGDARILSKLSQRVLDYLGMKLQVGTANPNFNGMIERAFNSMKDVQNATRTNKLGLFDFNRMLRAEDLRYNWKEHTTTREVPFARFMENAGKVRVLPEKEMYDALMFDELYLRIDSYLCYRIRGEVYQLPDHPPFNDMSKKHVTMKWNRRDADKAVIVWQGEEHETPILPQVIVPAAGDHPHVPKKNKVECFMEKAVSTDVSDLDTWEYLEKKYANVNVLFRPKEETVELPDRKVKTISRLDAMNRVRLAVVGEYGKLTPTQNEFLKSHIPDTGITEKQINKLIETIPAEQTAAG
jgi:hypothetical protein